MFRFVFCPTLFSGCGRVHSVLLHSHHHEFYTQASAVIHSLHSACASLWSFIPALAFPQKNYTSRQKIAPALRQSRWQSQPSLNRSGYLRLPPSLHSLSARLNAATKKCTAIPLSLHCAAFLVLRSGLFYLRWFGATPTPTPDHPPLKTVEFLILFALPRRTF